MPELDDYERLKRKVEAEISVMKGERPASESHEYQEFKKQYMPKHLSIYEKLCKFADNFGIKPGSKDVERYNHAIEFCHLSITPHGAYGLAVLTSALFLLVGILTGFVIPILLGNSTSMFFFGLFVLLSVSMFIPLKNLPFTFAEDWRMEASNQMILCLFYVCAYMRHTSNLENAIDFAADHIGPPLSLDLKKVMWDVQTERYSSLSESLDHYLLQWKETNLEFVETMNLVQSSLYESSQDRRLSTLEKAMNLILEETYEKMLHYAQELKSPMTMLHMLGVILPILGLVILPLAVSFIESVRWYHLFVLYNVVLPIGVFLLGRGILSKRPSGYGNTDITDINPSLKKYKNIIFKIGGTEREFSPVIAAAIVGGILFFIGLIPLILHYAGGPNFEITLFGPHKLLEYTTSRSGDVVGPYGLGASILSLFLTLGVGFGLAFYYNTRSKRIMKIRNESKELEQEFGGALFQLGNRLADGLPAELAFGKVSDIMSGTKSGDFFRTVAVNIQKMGLSIEDAIFDPHRGAILSYPSPIIESSMKILIESSKKGPMEASQSLITMSNYIKEMHRVEERLKDLLADIISGMKSQINFLTPAIAGIVIGITSMITTVLLSLQTKFQEFSDPNSSTSLGSFDQLLGLGIPTYYFQFIVGLYVVQITWILAYLVNGIENGKDNINDEYVKGKGLLLGTGLYVVISLVVLLIFNLIAGTILVKV